MGNACSLGLFRASLIQPEVARICFSCHSYLRLRKSDTYNFLLVTCPWAPRDLVDSWKYPSAMTCWGLFSVNVALAQLLSESCWAQSSSGTVSWSGECWLCWSTPLPWSCGIALLHAQLLWAIGPSVDLDVEIFLLATAFSITFLHAFHYLFKQVPWKWAENVESQYWKTWLCYYHIKKMQKGNMKLLM